MITDNSVSPYEAQKPEPGRRRAETGFLFQGNV